MEKKYSVLMSVYHKDNAVDFETALLSMLEQTAAPDELVLVKDGPLTKELDAVVEKLDRKYPGIFTVLVNEKNMGLGPSLQRGVEKCRNELIARMDSDDIARKDRVEAQLELFEAHPEISICGGIIREFEDGNFDTTIGYRTVPENHQELAEYLRKRCPFNHMTVMFRKSEVLRAGNYQDFLYNEDYLLWIRMLEAGCVFHNLQKILVDVRTNTGLYERRGGDVYFASEKGIQDIMLKDGIIDRKTYIGNMGKRIIAEKLLPARCRTVLYKLFARNKEFYEETK